MCPRTSQDTLETKVIFLMLRRTRLVVMGGAWAGMARVSSRVVLSSIGELVVGVSDKFPERDWNADSWEEVSK